MPTAIEPRVMLLEDLAQWPDEKDVQELALHFGAWVYLAFGGKRWEPKWSQDAQTPGHVEPLRAGGSLARHRVRSGQITSGTAARSGSALISW
jgi:hypothetical protein